MAIEVFLDPDVPGYDQLQRDLRDELSSVKSIKFVEGQAPAPPGTLSVEHTVLKFVIEHPSTITAVKAMIELIRSIIERRKIAVSAKQPPTVIVAGDLVLPVPSSPKKETRALQTLAEEGSDRKTGRAKQSRSTSPSKSVQGQRGGLKPNVGTSKPKRNRER